MPRQKKGDYVTLSDQATLAYGNLATLTAFLVLGARTNVTARAVLLNCRLATALSVTAPASGPFLFGIASEDITVALLEEFLENAGPARPDDQLKAEIASRSRRIRALGVINVAQAPSADDIPIGHFFEVTGLKLTLPEDAGRIAYWLYNHTNAGFPAGGSLNVTAQFTAKWLSD